MKKILLGLFLLIGTVIASPDSAPPLGPKLSILKISTAASVEIRLANNSKLPIKIFDESNSWGAMDWRVLRIRKGQVGTFYRSPYQMFTKNNPTFHQLLPGTYLDRKLDLNGGNWCGMGHCSWWDEKGLGGRTVSLEKGDQIIVIYEAPISKESQELKVFSGVEAASAIVQ